MRQLAAIEQHDGGRIQASALQHSLAAQDGLAAHVPTEQLIDVADREDVGIHNERPALEAEEGWDHAAEWGERLQIAPAPDRRRAAVPPEECLIVSLVQMRGLFQPEQADIEQVRALGSGLKRVRADHRGDHLLVIGVNDDGWFRGGYVIRGAPPPSKRFWLTHANLRVYRH